ncbi:MAG: 8-oxoguanine deaminase [Hyphomicrobiales bacterium]|nr:8-oxoguanine deaminase [Hyphomicrobiales bacterium]
MRTWIKDPLAIFAEGAARGLVVEGTRIAACVGVGASPERIDVVFDASRHVVLPGLINTHHHFFQTLTRAHPQAINKALFPWLIALYPVWARLTPGRLRLAARLALTELLMSGCTTAADHHYLYPAGLEDAVEIEVEAALELGMRMTVSRGSMNLSVKDGGLPPDSVVQDEETILKDSERAVKRFHDPRPGARIRVALAPCSPFSITKPLMSETAKLAARCDCRLHTHLCETADEERFCLKVYGLRPVDLLEETGWMSPRTWLAHGVHFNAEEICRLGKAGVGVCHCPTSNAVLASGLCPTCDLEAAGAPLGLGVDGSASNDASNMMEAIRHALMVGRLRYGADKVTHFDVLRWATEGSSRCLGRSDIGKIEEGREADLALFKLDEARFSGAHDPLAALVLCGAHRADRVMVAGEWRLVDGQPAGVDVAALIAEHKAAALDFA